jgi:hypothetical protein
MPKTMHPYAKCEQCVACDITGVCDGFHRDYAEIVGFDEASSITEGKRILDPRHYMRSQIKVVEMEEYGWALP